MCCILFKITFKGKIFKKFVFDDRVKHFCQIQILLSTKSSYHGYHYICWLNSGNVIIPNTLIIPSETAKLQITLQSQQFQNISFKTFEIPIHALTQFNDVIEKNMVININL